jgi:hypothetical protein
LTRMKILHCLRRVLRGIQVRVSSDDKQLKNRG